VSGCLDPIGCATLAALPLKGRLGHYELGGLIGSGGMGEVYRATDTRLRRDVALKVLPPAVAADADRLARFQAEARTLAAFDHPGIVTVYSVEQADSSDPAEHGRTVHFLTMQLIEGQPLDRVLPEDGFPLERFCEIGTALADALAAAHAKDIIHRDLKLANVMMTGDGAVKVLDFGIAKALTAGHTGDATVTSHGATAVGVVVGTPAAMAPEQIEGHPAQPSSDIFSLGVVLYQLATGRAPFTGSSALAIMSSIVRDTPPRPGQIRTRLPQAAEALILACLDKDATRRPTAPAVADALRRLRDGSAVTRSSSRMRRWGAIAAAVCVTSAILLAWSNVSRSRRDVFVAESLPRIESLAVEGRYQEGFELAKAVDSKAAGRIPEKLWDLVTTRASVTSQPAGAAVTLRPVGGKASTISLGTTPLAQVRVPRGAFHWRVEHAGYLPADLVTENAGSAVRFELRPADGPDPGMIRIPGGDVRLWALAGVRAEPVVKIGAYLIDRHEVTNREFARFVAAGGYTREEFWKHPFSDGARTLSFPDAMARFKDSTGRPGPATWKLGSYLDGQDDLPVGGLSWYEASAYAAFAGKELPTVYHWYQADTAGDIQLLPGLVLATTNHEGAGLRPAGAPGSISAYGAIDMAGNVREWAANASDASTRIALGGAWSDPAYLYLFPEARSPFDRADGNGVRCIKPLDTETRAVAAAALPPRPVADPGKARPASDAEYAIYTRFFERKPTPLAARIESTDESSPHWIKQRVSFAAGYGQERLTALLYLPRSARPPYQAIIQMAGAATFYRRSSATEKDIFGWGYAEYLIRGGRAVMIPIWKGSYERSDGFHPLQTGWPSYREHVVQWVSELRQSVDYLQSRDDIADGKIGFQGISNGAIWAPIFMALEPRLETGIFLLGGLLTMSIHETPMPPEIDGRHYAPRVRAPVLMMNGRHDAIFPYETSQLTLLRVLGTSDADKRHIVFPGGHSSFGWMNQLIKEGLDWLDQRFGPPARHGS
jgi:serine/threonine protein kinase/predicted esterase